MTRYEKIVVIFAYVAIVFLVAAATYIGITQCHGQCGEGDRQCQDRCFKKGHCPFEER